MSTPERSAPVTLAAIPNEPGGVPKTLIVCWRNGSQKVRMIHLTRIETT